MKYCIYLALLGLSQGINLRRSNQYIPNTLEPCPAGGGTLVDGTTPALAGTNCRADSYHNHVGLSQRNYIPNTLEPCVEGGGGAHTNIDGTTPQVAGANCKTQAVTKNVNTLVQLNSQLNYEPNRPGVLEICPDDGGTLVDGTTKADPGVNCQEGTFNKNVVTSLVQLNSQVHYEPNRPGVLEICPDDGGTLVDGTTKADPGVNCQEGTFNKNVVTSLVQLNYEPNRPGVLEICPDDGGTLVDGTTAANPGVNCQEGTFNKNVVTSLVQLNYEPNRPGVLEICPDDAGTLVDGTTPAQPGVNCQEGTFNKNVVTSLAQVKSSGLPADPTKCKERGETMIDCQSRVQK